MGEFTIQDHYITHFKCVLCCLYSFTPDKIPCEYIKENSMNEREDVYGQARVGKCKRNEIDQAKRLSQ